MGRVERDISEEIMSVKEIILLIIRDCPNLIHFQAYMFGSSLNRIGEDYDVLIVGDNTKYLSCLKQEIYTLKNRLPLDVLYMTKKEEKETNFIMKAGCISFEKLSQL